jgi:hypothetical protein
MSGVSEDQNTHACMILVASFEKEWPQRPRTTKRSLFIRVGRGDGLGLLLAKVILLYCSRQYPVARGLPCPHAPIALV